MKTVAPGHNDPGERSEYYSSPEIECKEQLHDADNGELLRSPLEIRDFLRQRMAVCLPRIGVMGQHHSAGICAMAPSQRKPVVPEGRQEFALTKVMCG